MDLSTVTIFSAVVTFIFSLLYYLAKKQLRPTSFEEAVREQKASRELLLGKQVPNKKKKSSNSNNEVNLRKRAAVGGRPKVFTTKKQQSSSVVQVEKQAKKEELSSSSSSQQEKQKPKVELTTTVQVHSQPPTEQLEKVPPSSVASSDVQQTTTTTVQVHSAPSELLEKCPPATAAPSAVEIQQVQVKANKKKKHVEINQVTIEEFSPSAPPSTLHRRDSMSNVSTHSILINKEELSPLQDPSRTQGQEEENHFTTTKPRDDYLLMRRKSESSEEGRLLFADAVDGALVSTTAAAAESEASDEVQASTSSQAKKKKNKKDFENISSDQLLKIVVQARLTHSEVNSLVDALLNKSGEVGGLDDSWIQPATPSTTALQAKQTELLQQLSDSESTLNSLRDKLKELRVENQAEKTKSATYKKQLDDLVVKEMRTTKQLNLQINNLNQQLHQQQQQHTLTTQEKDALRSQSQHLESQLQAAFNSNQELSNKLARLQEHLLQENERKNEEMAGVSMQIQLQMEERERSLMNEMGRREADLRREMDVKLQDAEKRLLEITSMEKNTRNLLASAQGQVKDLQSQLESNSSKNNTMVNNLQEEISKLNAEITKLNQDCAKYQDLATSNDNNNEEIAKLKADLEASTLKCNEADSKLELLQQNEVKSREAILAIEGELKTVKIEFAATKVEEEKLKSEVIGKEAKVAELRGANSSLLDSLKKTEALTAELNGKWEAVNELLVQNGMEPNNTSPSTFLTTKLSSLSAQCSATEKESANYKQILADTEELLSNLQNSLAKHEDEMRVKLEAKDAELERLKQLKYSQNGNGNNEMNGNGSNNPPPPAAQQSSSMTTSSSPSPSSTTSSLSPSIDSLHIPSSTSPIKSPSLNQTVEGESPNEDLAAVSEKKKKKRLGSFFKSSK